MMRKKRRAVSRSPRLKPIRPRPPINDVITDSFVPGGMVPDGGAPMPDYNPGVPARPNMGFANPEPDMGVDDAWFGQPQSAQPMPFPMGPIQAQPMPFPGMGSGQPAMPGASGGPRGIHPQLLEMLRALLAQGGRSQRPPVRRDPPGNPLIELLRRGGLGRM